MNRTKTYPIDALVKALTTADPVGRLNVSRAEAFGDRAAEAMERCTRAGAVGHARAAAHWHGAAWKLARRAAHAAIVACPDLIGTPKVVVPLAVAAEDVEFARA